jgi:hypothetical protein
MIGGLNYAEISLAGQISSLEKGSASGILALFFVNSYSGWVQSFFYMSQIEAKQSCPSKTP